MSVSLGKLQTQNTVLYCSSRHERMCQLFIQTQQHGLKIAANAVAVKLLTHFCWISETRDSEEGFEWWQRVKQMQTYHSSKVYRHEGMAGQEEIVQPDHMAEIWQHVSEPCDEPAEGENRAHFSSVEKIKMLISNYSCE